MNRGFGWLIGLLGAAVCTTGASAADVSTEGSAGLEEIVVTAEKRSERELDVPMAISTVSTQDLATQDLVQLRDYYSRIPDLQFNGDRTTDLSLRGVTTGGVTNPTIAILVDDVQFGSSTAAGLTDSHFPDFDPALFDRIEVLRGPQGTLYGASSMGGLIKFVTRQPDTEQFSGRAEAGFESTQGGDIGYTTRASVNIPLVSDMIGLRVGGFKRDDPAWLDNVASPDTDAVPRNNANSANTYGGHAALLIKPVDGLSITLSAIDQRRNARFYSGIQVNENAAGYPVYTSPVYGYYTNLSLGPTADVGNQQLYSARVVGDFLGMQLTSISAYGKSAGTNFQDVSSVFTFLPFVYGPGSTSIADAAETEKFSQELRLSGKLAQLDWRLGAFYTREAGSVDQTLFFTGPGVSATPYVGLGPNTYKERAIFADATYHINSQWELQAGVRWAKNSQVEGSSAVVDPPATMFFGPSNTGVNLRSDDTSTTWQLSPTFHITPDLMTYVRVATGYRPGGPNTVLPNVPGTFGPDKVTNYELGLKGITDDKTVSYDLAVFDIEWKNIQLQDTDAASEFTYTTNGGKARSRGLEAQVNWKPYKDLDVGANFTYLDATLTQDVASVSGTDTLVGKSGDRLPGSARFTTNLSAEKSFPIAADVTGFIGGNWSFVGSRESEFQLFVPSDTDPAANTSTPRFQLPSYSLLDFQGGASFRGWRATAFLRNAANSHGVLTADNRNGTSVTSVDFLQPRTVGLTVSYEF